jgi:hypothetical protein
MTRWLGSLPMERRRAHGLDELGSLEVDVTLPLAHGGATQSNDGASVVDD